MDDRDLKQLLDADVPGSDAAFVIAVMAKIERRQFHRSLLRAGGIALMIGLILAASMPFLNEVIAMLAKPMTNEWVIAGLLLAAGTLAYLRWPLRDGF